MPSARSPWPRPFVVSFVLGAGLGALLALLCGCGRAASSPAGPLAARGRGPRLYTALCAACHGEDGRAAEGSTRYRTEPPAGDLTRCNFKYRSTPAGSLPTDSDLLRTLATGVPGTRMPGFSGAVREEALAALVGEVRARCRLFAEDGPGPEVPWPGPPRGDAARGHAVFTREQCAACHGEQGRGDGRAARFLKDALGRKIRPRDVTQGVTRGGHALLDLYRAFSTGLSGTPMPAVHPRVTRAERWDLATYLASLGRDAEGKPRRPFARPLWPYFRFEAWGTAEPAVTAASPAPEVKPASRAGGEVSHGR